MRLAFTKEAMPNDTITATKIKDNAMPKLFFGIIREPSVELECLKDCGNSQDQKHGADGLIPDDPGGTHYFRNDVLGEFAGVIYLDGFYCPDCVRKPYHVLMLTLGMEARTSPKVREPPLRVRTVSGNSAQNAF